MIIVGHIQSYLVKTSFITIEMPVSDSEYDLAISRCTSTV